VRITEAIPIMMPSTVSKERIRFSRTASRATWRVWENLTPPPPRDR